jgi:hypothetical protein
MTAHLTPSRLRKVRVPDDLKKAVARFVGGRPNIHSVAVSLGVAITTMEELTAVVGFVQPKTIVKVRAKLEELARAHVG